MREKEKGKKKKGIIVVVLSFLVGLFIGVVVGMRLRGKEEVGLDTEVKLSEKLLEGNMSGGPPSERLPLTFYEKLEQEVTVPHVEDTQTVTVPQASVEVKKRELEGLTKGAAFLQVGAFKEQRNAKLLVDRLRSQGYDVNLYRAKIKGKNWYRVVVKFSTPKEAEEAMVKLKKEGVTEVRMLREE